jgi:heat shock protein HspQ
MELKIGDLVRHNVHGYYGIVVSHTGYWGQCLVCKVEWVHSNYNHIIDINFLDKISK